MWWQILVNVRFEENFVFTDELSGFQSENFIVTFLKEFEHIENE